MARSTATGGRRPGRPRRRRGRSPAWWALALAVLVVAAFLLYRSRPPAGGPEPAREERAAPEGEGPAAAAEPGEERGGERSSPEEDAREAEAGAALPELEASDGFVRERARGLSEHPDYRRWLSELDGILRRAVATAENLAAGSSPSRHWGLLAPERPFTVRERPDGTVVPSPESYARYDAHAEAFASLDVERTATLYRRVLPLLRVAYRELGHPEGGFEAALREAVAELRATPRLDAPPALVERGARWEYRDPELEALSPAQKHLLRMGPENAARVRAKLDALAEALGLEAEG